MRFDDDRCGLDGGTTHRRDDVTNAVAEGLTRTIMAITRQAGGSRSVANFKDVIHL